MAPSPPRRGFGASWRWRRALLGIIAAVGAMFATVCLVALIEAGPAMGESPDGGRLARISASPQWRDGAFRNPQPMRNQVLGALLEVLGASEHAAPPEPLRLPPTDPEQFRAPPLSGLRVTWMGHATVLVEIDGRTLLTDPIWGPRASPLPWLGPERWYEAPIALDDLPRVDAVLISHDHYDHLDFPTVTLIEDRAAAFIVPLGVGAHLESWGVAEAKIVELDWWEAYSIGDLEVVATPARHSSGRSPLLRDRTLWAGFALLGPRHRVFFSGDTGMFPGITEVGARYGPFDMTLIEIGTYAQSWADWHMGPEQGVAAHLILGGSVLLPIHWGLFNLSTHAWTEPMERVLVAAEAEGVTVLGPLPGASVEPRHPPELEKWWPDLPWRTAEAYPVVSSGLARR